MRNLNSLFNKILEINCKYLTPILLSLFLMFICCIAILVLDERLYHYLSNWRLLVLIPIVYLCMYLTLRPALFAFKNWIVLLKNIMGLVCHEK